MCGYHSLSAVTVFMILNAVQHLLLYKNVGLSTIDCRIFFRYFICMIWLWWFSKRDPSIVLINLSYRVQLPFLYRQKIQCYVKDTQIINFLFIGNSYITLLISDSYCFITLRSINDLYCWLTETKPPFLCCHDLLNNTLLENESW